MSGIKNITNHKTMSQFSDHLKRTLIADDPDGLAVKHNGINIWNPNRWYKKRVRRKTGIDTILLTPAKRL